MTSATATLHSFRIRTTDREVVIEAESMEHAHGLFTGKVWPPNIPPVPSPAYRTIPNSGGLSEPTPEWTRWYNDEFLPQRANYPVLAWAHGECMLSVAPISDDGVHVVTIDARNATFWMTCPCGWSATVNGYDNKAEAHKLAEAHAHAQ